MGYFILGIIAGVNIVFLVKCIYNIIWDIIDD